MRNIVIQLFKTFMSKRGVCLPLASCLLSLSFVTNAADSLPDLIQQGEREQALEMIRVGADVNMRQGDGSTALLWQLIMLTFLLPKPCCPVRRIPIL